MRAFLLTFVLAACPCVAVMAHDADTPPSGATATTNTAMVAALASDEYAIREEAFHHLMDAGQDALPALAAAIHHEDAEVAWRVRRLIVEIGVRGDEETLARTTAIIEELGSSGHTSFVGLGDQVRRWREIQHLPEREQIERMNRWIFGGGNVDPAFFARLRGC